MASMSANRLRCRLRHSNFPPKFQRSAVSRELITRLVDVPGLLAGAWT
jgi:hypothetical protein